MSPEVQTSLTFFEGSDLLDEGHNRTPPYAIKFYQNLVRIGRVVLEEKSLGLFGILSFSAVYIIKKNSQLAKEQYILLLIQLKEREIEYSTMFGNDL